MWKMKTLNSLKIKIKTLVHYLQNKFLEKRLTEPIQHFYQRLNRKSYQFTFTIYTSIVPHYIKAYYTKTPCQKMAI